MRLMVIALTLALCLSAACLTGCNAGAMTDEQLNVWKQQVNTSVAALRDAGVEGQVFARMRIDKIGSIEQSLNGPGELEVFIVGELEPADAPAPQ